DRQGRIRLLRLLADDDGVFGYLHRGRRQLADGDVPARDLDPPAHRQSLIGQHQAQVRLDFQLGVRLDHYRQPRAGQVQIQVERLLPVQGAVQAALALFAAAPVAVDAQLLPFDTDVDLQPFEADGQLTAGNLRLAQAQIAVQLRALQRSRQSPGAVELALQPVHLRHEG